MSMGDTTDLYDLRAETEYSQAFSFIICNVYGEYETAGENGVFSKTIYDAGRVYPARQLKKIQKFGGADLLENEITGVQ